MRALLEPDDCWFRPYFMVDEGLRVCAWPEATARALGLPAQSALGRHCWDLLATTQCRRCRDRSGGDDSGAPTCTRLELQTGQKRWIVWCDLRHIARGDPGSTALEGLLVRSAVDPAPRRASLPETLDLIRSACGADDCELFLLDGRGREVALRCCVGADRDAFLQQTRMPLGYGYPGTVTLTCRPLCTDRVQDDDRFRRDAVKRRGIRTFIGVPVLEGGGPVGYLGAGWKHPSIPLAWGLQMLQAMQPVALDAARRAGPVGTVALTDCALRCFGPLEIALGDRRLSQEAFDRRKSLDLLRHLLLARDTPTPRDVLIEKLWPEAPPAAGTNRLHVALNSLRQTLAAVLPERAISLVQQRHGHYRLNLAALGTVDAYLFSDGLDAARVRLRGGDRDRAVESLEQVLPLYRGDLFADADDVAFEIPRQRFRLRYREALRLLVDLYLRQGRLDAAISVLTDAIDRTSSESELHEGLLHELVAQQRPVTG